MLKALIATINPKGGKGMTETIIFIALLVAVFTLNILQIPASPEMQYLMYALVAGMGYMVGTNAKPKEK